jgi:hypothetical protein
VPGYGQGWRGLRENLRQQGKTAELKKIAPRMAAEEIDQDGLLNPVANGVGHV